MEPRDMAGPFEEAGQVRPRERTALAWLGLRDQLRAELKQDSRSEQR